jgi:osomolarity two-component system response regulator SSK1
MDIQMPVMDGIQATKEIRQLEAVACTPTTPQSDGSARTPSDVGSSESRTTTATSPYRSSVIIVALTASSLQSDRVAALAAGCNDFLTKPVSLQWLNNKIIEWGSIKALQMWADLRPEAAKSISTEQSTQAQAVARRLHVPEGRATPMNHSPSRSSSIGKTEGHYEGVSLIVSSNVLPPSEKLDALLKLSEKRSTSSTNYGPDPTNRHEGATTSSRHL